jgi:hypothetical protein
MENRSTILNELREISPVLAQTDLQNPYQAPAGYFESLAGEVLQKVKGQFYQVPDNYFETLPDQLLQKVKGQFYEIPLGYFESLPETILNRIKADQTNDAGEELEMLSPLLKGIGKKNPFSMPEGYFSELSDNAIAGAQALDFVQEELSSPLLDGLKNKQVYEVPAGYFEQLPERLLNKVQPQQSGKVVSMRFTKRIMQYAAAAVIAGIIITTGWLYLGNNNTPDSDLPPVVATNIDKISDEVLESYIENQSILPVENTVIASNTDFDATDMKDMLADVSDEDLQQYIDKYNTAKDIITN